MWYNHTMRFYSSTAIYNGNEPQRHYVKGKKQNARDYILYDSIYMKWPEMTNL